MADVNVNAPVDQAPTMAPPTRIDDQILPHIRWHTNFFRAFTASSTIPSIYIQQFWDTVRYDKTAGCYKCQLDEQWNLSNVVTNDMFQPWRALTTIINLCLMEKTSGVERPTDPVLQILWDVVNRAHLKYVERIWEEFTQSIHTFIEDKKNLAQHTHEKKKATLIVILSEPYYQEYLEKVAKHQRYLVGEQGSDPNSPAPKPTKATKKSKPSAPKADPRPPVIKPASSRQPEPKPAPAKSQGKKRKLVTKTSDKPSPARKSRPGSVSKRRKPTCFLRSVDESVAEGIPEKEPRVDDEEADVHRALEESLKSIYDAPRGPLPPVVIREPESGKYQPLLETPKKKSLADRFIFQRRTSTPTGSSSHDESLSLYAEIGLADSEVESDEDVLGINAGVLDKGQARPNPGFTATTYPKVQENLKLTVKEHVILEEPASSTGTLSSLQHLAKDLSYGDIFFNDKPSEADNEKTTAKTKAESMLSVTIQQDTSSIPLMTTSVIDLTSRPDSPNVHWLLQAKETETTTTTIYPPPSQPQQSTTDSMLMKRIDIPKQVSKDVDEIVTDAVDWSIQALLRNRFRDLLKADMKEILHQRMWETNSYKTHEDHMMLYEALEKSMKRDHSEELLKDLAEAHKKKKKRRDSPKTPPRSPPHQPPPPPPPAGPSRTSRSHRASGSSQVPPIPPPPPSTNQECQSHGSIAQISLKTSASAKYKAWTMTDIRLKLSVSLTLKDIQMDDDMAPDAQAHSSDDEDIGNAYISKTGDMAMFMDWFCKRQGITKLKPQGLEGPAFELVKVFHPNWFQRQRFYINRHTYEGDRRAVRTHMRILRVVRIEVFSMYGYDYIKKIILRKADLNEHIIVERDFKYLYPSDFEDLYLLNLQGHLNHLPPKDKKILTTIDEALDYRVKEFNVNRMNPGLNTRFWTRKDVDRSKEFMFAIQKRLKTRRIFHNLESFVSRRVRDEDYRLLKRTE
nr:hypothetical protein [Tanacetum cinerariifolium]